MLLLPADSFSGLPPFVSVISVQDEGCELHPGESLTQQTATGERILGQAKASASTASENGGANSRVEKTGHKNNNNKISHKETFKFNVYGFSITHDKGLNINWVLWRHFKTLRSIMSLCLWYHFLQDELLASTSSSC